MDNTSKYMDYTNKYIKYKNKYMTLKNQYGNGNEYGHIKKHFKKRYTHSKIYRAPACTVNKNTKKKVHCNIRLNNRLDTCWLISILMIFILSDSTSKCVQSVLFNMKARDIFNNSNRLLKYILPDSIFVQSAEIINLLNYIKLKFNIKIADVFYNDEESDDEESDDEESDDDNGNANNNSDNDSYDSYNGYNGYDDRYDNHNGIDYNRYDARYVNNDIVDNSANNDIDNNSANNDIDNNSNADTTYIDTPNRLRRQDSYITEKNLAEIVYILFDKTRSISNDDNEFKYTTYTREQFFLVNILSCSLLQKLIDFNIFLINNKININLLENTIGILVKLRNHVCSFYICENKMKFCNNNMIINYNWIELFKKCNELYMNGQIYNIYLNMSVTNFERGPFIHYDNILIYFDKEHISYEENTSDTDFSNAINYISMIAFIYLIYNNKKDTFKNNNGLYYLEYYIPKNDIEEIDKLLYEYPDIYINDMNGEQRTVLYEACYNGKIRIVELLLKHPKIDVNKGFKLLSPLYISCYYNFSDIVKLLVKHPKINVNKEFEGKTLLYTVCNNGYTNIVKELLTHPNIDVNKDFEGKTPLYIACNYGYNYIVEALLRHPNINKDLRFEGKTPLNIAMEKHHNIIIHLFNSYTPRYLSISTK